MRRTIHLALLVSIISTFTVGAGVIQAQDEIEELSVPAHVMLDNEPPIGWVMDTDFCRVLTGDVVGEQELCESRLRQLAAQVALLLPESFLEPLAIEPFVGDPYVFQFAGTGPTADEIAEEARLAEEAAAAAEAKKKARAKARAKAKAKAKSKAAARKCDPSYPTLCLRPGAADLNCDDISARGFRVRQPDPHGFDRDRDGVGCES